MACPKIERIPHGIGAMPKFLFILFISDQRIKETPLMYLQNDLTVPS
jgi:hypothetical protein